MFDVFLSYPHVDALPVRALADALERRGVSVWLDEKRIDDFASIQRNIENGLTRAKAVVVWYSGAYPASRACQWELTRAFVAAQQEGDPRRRVLLINPETSNAHIHPVPLRDALYRAAPGNPDDLASTADAVAGHARGLAGTLGEIAALPAPAWFGSAHGDGSNRFVGRFAELWAIHSALWSSDVPIITGVQSRPVVRATGIGGVGKSLAAEVYAIRFGSAYPGGVFWMAAYGNDAAEASHADAGAERQMADFAQQLGIATFGLEDAQLRRQLGERLDAREPYLWVVDDLPSGISWEEAQRWLPPGKSGKVLITTRSDALDWAGTQVIIGELDESSSLDLLTHARKPANTAEEEEARQITRELGYHPLALELAAVAVRRRGFLDFRASLESPSRDALDFAAQLLAAHGTVLPHRRSANLNLSTTLLQSIDELTPEGKDFLRLAAQLAPIVIARAIAVRALGHAQGRKAEDAADAADLAIASVLALSLAREVAPENYLVHTLVSRAMRYRDQDQARRPAIRRGAVSALHNELGDDRVFDVRRHAELSDTVAHARVLLGQGSVAEDQPPKGLSRSAALLDSLYIYWLHRGNYREARQVTERLVEYARQSFGEEEDITLTFQSYLGHTLHELGELARALTIQQQVFELRRRRFGVNPTTVTALSDVAWTLQAQGKLHAAWEIQEQVLAWRTSHFGPQHLHTAHSMMNLALTLNYLGNTTRARELMEDAVALRKQQLGESHPDTLEAIGNLLEIARAEGKLADAEREGARLLEIRRAQGGDTHPETMLAMNNLGVTRFSRGDVAGANELLEKALKLRALHLGAEHPLTIQSMLNLAWVLPKQGRAPEARKLLTDAHALAERVLGPDHAHTAQAAYMLRILDRKQESRTGSLNTGDSSAEPPS